MVGQTFFGAKNGWQNKDHTFFGGSCSFLMAGSSVTEEEAHTVEISPKKIVPVEIDRKNPREAK